MTRLPRLMVVLVMTVIVLSSWTLASAKDPAPPKKPGEKTYDQWEGDVIDPEKQRPDNMRVDVYLLEKAASLIDIRPDFVDELVRSAEDL